MEIKNKSGQIHILEEDEKISIKRATNHNELSIMESDWKELNYKVNSIRFSKIYWIPQMILGAAVSYFVDGVMYWRKGEDVKYLPLVICLALYVLFTIFIKNKTDDTSNQVHLNDVKRILKRIEDNQN